MKKFEDDPNTKTDNILALAEAFFPYFCVSVGLIGTLAAILVPNLSFELRLLALTTANSPTILGASITEHHSSKSQYNMSRKPPTIKNISALNYSDPDECEDSSEDNQGSQGDNKYDQF